MADIRWIKIITDIFSDEKILLIETMPEADSIIVIWFKLLCMAGAQNECGIVCFKNRLPYTDEMLSAIMRRPINTVRLALDTFEKFGMIERSDNGIISIPNWEKHQNVEGMEKVREQGRLRQQKYRESQRLALTENAGNKPVEEDVTLRNVIVTEQNKKREEKEKEEEIDKEKDKREVEEKKSPANYQLIADMYNDTCVSFPRLTTLSEARKKALRARLNTYSMADFQRLFEKAEASSFLKGGNDRNWSATFDWMIKDSNMAKVLDGNYDNKEPIKQQKPRIDWENV